MFSTGPNYARKKYPKLKSGASAGRHWHRHASTSSATISAPKALKYAIVTYATHVIRAKGTIFVKGTNSCQRHGPCSTDSSTGTESVFRANGVILLCGY
eukprot:5047872-Ditylum_brightwellii.AAC.2